MEQQNGAEVGPGSTSPPSGLRDELLGPPRPSTRGQVFAAAFGLLLITSLAVPATSQSVELALGGITAMGFAELLDRTLHRFVICLRFIGLVVALSGGILPFF